MLCVASIKAKSEVTFGLVQSVLTKLIKRHSSSANHSLSTRSLNFYVQHVNYELISGESVKIKCSTILFSPANRN